LIGNSLSDGRNGPQLVGDLRPGRSETAQPSFVGETNMNLVALIISLVSGAVGGNLAGTVMKDKSLGTLGNSLAGVFGGGIGAFVLQALGLVQEVAGGGVDLATIVANVVSGGIGGSVLLFIVSLLKGVLGSAKQ
jgi:uncharacterized membrane protein YeaQ/YmgE (transglycosylase-associated protein family)